MPPALRGAGGTGNRATGLIVVDSVKHVEERCAVSAEKSRW